MTDFATLLRPDRGEPARLLHLVDATLLPEWLKAHAGPRRQLVEAARFEGKAGQFLLIPGSAAGGTAGSWATAQAMTAGHRPTASTHPSNWEASVAVASRVTGSTSGRSCHTAMPRRLAAS